jgi:hypothetical protein
MFVRGNADDIVVGIDNPNHQDKAIEIVDRWSRINKVNLNTNKSGVMRLLCRQGKISNVRNKLGINEVSSYKYLRITLTQSMKLSKYLILLRKKEQFL